MLYPQYRNPTQTKKRAFALIVAMALMGFLFLLLVGLAALIQVESQLQYRSEQQTAAQENALFGLQVALSELQAAAGVDQRVTGTGALDGTASSGQERWTGVWRTDEASSDYTDNAAWLISKTGGITTGSLDTIVIPSYEQIEITRPYSDATTGTSLEPVIVGKVPVGNGSYAFWVSDEGVKAKVNLAQDDATGDIATMRQHSLAPQRYGVEAIEALQDYDIFHKPTIERVDRLSDVNLLGGVTPPPEQLYLLSSALTTHSYSTLADVKNGGLRKDLTAGLQAGAAEPSGQIFGPQLGGSATDSDPGGPSWEQLRSFFNLYPDSSGEVEVREQLDDQAGVYPVMAAMQMYIYVSYRMVNGKAEMINHIMPAVVLWNPYSVPLKADDYIVHFGRVKWKEGLADSEDTYNTNNLYFEDVFYSYRIYRQIESSNGSEEYESDTNAFFPGWDFVSFEIPSVSFAPGEAKVFSPPAWQTEYIRGGSGSASTENDPNILEEGMRPGASFFQYNTAKNLNRDSQGNLLNKVKPALQSRREFAWRLARKSQGTLVDSEPLQVVMTLNTASLANVSPPPIDVQQFNPNQPLTEQDQFYGYKTVMNFTNNSLPSGFNKPAWAAQFNPRATYSGSSQYEWRTGSALDPDAFMKTQPSVNPSFLTYTDTLEANVEYYINETADGGAYIGYSEGNGPDKAVLFEIPQSDIDITSLGQLAHANLSNFHRQTSDSQSDFTRKVFRNARVQNLTPAYAIGNSLANPRIARDATFSNMADLEPSYLKDRDYFDFKGLLYDYPYLLNEALWDSYFFSTVPRGNIDPENALPNPRMAVTPVDTDTGPALQDYNRAAANLMIDGGFNVNSTSPEAWTALLASFFGESMEDESGGFASVDAQEAAYPRGQRLWGAAFDRDQDDVSSQAAYTGYRTLNQEEIRELGTAIAEQVRMRGPFRSLTEFVNRSLTTGAPKNWSDPDNKYPYEWNAKGVLQAAIDRVSQEAANAGKNLLNARFYQSSDMAEASDYSGDTLPFSQAELLPRAAENSGYFSQVDLLYRLGSVLVARSDTFVIRAYGETKNPLTNKVEATAWCEAVVQRLPDYLNSDADPDPELAPQDVDNQHFGRKFRVLSFRWLNGSASNPPSPELDS